MKLTNLFQKFNNSLFDNESSAKSIFTFQIALTKSCLKFHTHIRFKSLKKE